MKQLPIILIALVFHSVTLAQKIEVKDISKDSSVSYILANINKQNYTFYKLYNGSFFINIFTMTDPKATKEGVFEETDEILLSILISVVSDGDYSINNKLFKIEGLVNPKIVEIQETKFPGFNIAVESGFFNKRKVNTYTFKGIDNYQGGKNK